MNASANTRTVASPETSGSADQGNGGESSAPPLFGPDYPDKKNYTLKEAALYLNVSTRTVERLLQRRLLRRNKALRKILIPRTELDQFIERNL